jgi:hypothetical protein
MWFKIRERAKLINVVYLFIVSMLQIPKLENKITRMYLFETCSLIFNEKLIFHVGTNFSFSKVMV